MNYSASTGIVDQASQAERKKYLIDVASSFGSIKQVCPSCDSALSKFPMRKTVCAVCGNPIYSRKEPISGEKRLYREIDLPLWSELHQHALGTWDWWNNCNIQLSKAKDELSSEWNVPKALISDADANWRILHSRLELAVVNGDIEGYRFQRVEMIRQLIKEKRFAMAADLSGESIYLAYALPKEPWFVANGKEFPEKGSQNIIYDPELYLYLSILESGQNILASDEDMMAKNWENKYKVPIKVARMKFETALAEYRLRLEERLRKMKK